MKKYIGVFVFAFFPFVGFVVGEWVATLCPATIANETAPLYGAAPQYVLGASSNVYKACWAQTVLPSSATHTNLSVSTNLVAEVAAAASGKSVAITGITDPAALMAALGMSRCDADGNPLEESEP